MGMNFTISEENVQFQLLGPSHTNSRAIVLVDDACLPHTKTETATIILRKIVVKIAHIIKPAVLVVKQRCSVYGLCCFLQFQL